MHDLKKRQRFNPIDIAIGTYDILNSANEDFLKKLETEYIEIITYLNYHSQIYSSFKTKYGCLYFPFLKDLTGSTNASLLTSVLLQRILFIARSESLPLLSVEFYKFLTPCDSPYYKKNNSWTEELNISEREYRTAINKISSKFNKNTPPELIKNNKLFLHKQDVERRTWYRLNPNYSGAHNG